MGTSFTICKRTYYKNAAGETIYTSARDIGNIAAGYVAGINGIAWPLARKAFDMYQGGIEGVTTQNAEFKGWSLGYSNYINHSIFHSGPFYIIDEILGLGWFISNK